MIAAPCKNCKDRFEACHDTCDRFKAYTVEKDKIKAERDKYYQAIAYQKISKQYRQF